MSEQVGDRHRGLRSLAAATAALCGVTAVSAAAAYEAVARTDTSSGWRNWLGPLGWISIWGALGAVALGLTASMTRESHRRRVAATAVGAGLGLVVLLYWFFTIESILDTT